MKFKYFVEKEIVGLQMELVRRLDLAREYAGTPFIITSGLRSKSKNQSVGGVEKSAHIKGLAVDLKAIDGKTKYKIITGLLSAGFDRIGVYKTHIHADIDNLKPKQIIWHG